MDDRERLRAMGAAKRRRLGVRQWQDAELSAALAVLGAGGEVAGVSLEALEAEVARRARWRERLIRGGV